MVLLSSHISKRRDKSPFPQEDKQIEGLPEQVYPALMIPLFEQPSVSIEFPSSHCSSSIMIPSPCFGEQKSGLSFDPPKQTQVERTDRQSDVHPFPSFQSMSSHDSGTLLF